MQVLKKRHGRLEVPLDIQGFEVRQMYLRTGRESVHDGHVDTELEVGKVGNLFQN